MDLTEKSPLTRSFVRRHIGPNAGETGDMLALLGQKIWTDSLTPPFKKNPPR